MGTTYKITFFCGFILFGLLLCPLVTAFDGRSVQYFDDGVSLSRTGHYTEAIALFDKALVFEPNYVDAWTQRGFALSKLGQYTEAVASFDKAIDINPNSADEKLWNERGAALYQISRYSEAVASFDKAITINPYDEQAKQNREIAREKQGLAQQAQQKTKTTPLTYALPGAIILMAGIAVWNQRQSSF